MITIYTHTYIVQTCWKIASQVVQRSLRLCLRSLAPTRSRDGSSQAGDTSTVFLSVCHLGRPWSWCHGAMVPWSGGTP